MSNFINKCLTGDAFVDEIDDYIDAWHDGDSPLELNEFLGMTKEEYNYFAMDEDVLPIIIRSHRFKKTIDETINASQENELSLAARTSDKDKVKQLIAFLKNE